MKYLYKLLFATLLFSCSNRSFENNSNANQNKGINGTWIYIGWENSAHKSVIAGGFVYQERYWKISNDSISIYDVSNNFIGAMDYKNHGDTILINDKPHFKYSLKNDTLLLKELMSKNKISRVLIKKI
tara:strand:- start:222 stop:605 length:384 start_codon:yes stop_codon:yes gene_type:complete